jgi:hypothetical protein
MATMARTTTITVMLGLAAAACGSSSNASSGAPSIVAITACPEGATLTGEAPPKGLRQRCQRTETERHGASREWYEDGRERSYSEWWAGTKHGRFTLWYKSGRVRSEGAHRHGVPAGPWTYYREDGTVDQQQTFTVSPPAGDWLAQAIAGHPPLDEKGEVAGGTVPDGDSSGAGMAAAPGPAAER